MPDQVVLAVLASALMHAGWNFLIKSSHDKLVDTVLLALGGTAVAALILPWVPLPAPESRGWLGMSTFVHVAYYVALVESYRHADLSVAYPVMRGLAPMLVAVSAPLFGEAWSPAVLLGSALIGFGLMLPTFIGLRAGKVRGHGLVVATATAGLIALYTFIDGSGVRRSGSAVSYTLWLFFFNSWGILSFALMRRGRAFLPLLTGRRTFALAGAVLTMGSYGIVLWAMQIASIPAVAALRESSVIFAAILGSVFLKEEMGRLRLAGAVLVAVGAGIVRWS